MRFIADRPIEAPEGDKFGFNSEHGIVRELQSAIYNTEAPFVYGVLGDWGTGKTSILRLLEARLEADTTHPFIPIWFDAWKYENEASIVYPLLHTIKKHYEANPNTKDLTDKAGGFFKAFGKVMATSLLALGQLGLKAAISTLTAKQVELDDLEKSLETIQKQDKGGPLALIDTWADAVGKIGAAFKELLTAYAEDIAPKMGFAAKDITFVLLIDDLDRCLPETTISILEGIKNHLTVDHCVFVLALNASVIYQAIQRKYNGMGIDGRAYLEKILNYSFYVPEPPKQAIATFVKSTLGNLADTDTVTKLGNKIDRVGSTLADTGFSNPRKIKRILNRVLILMTMENSPFEMGVSTEDGVKLVAIAEYFPDVFNRYVAKPKDAATEIDDVISSKISIADYASKTSTQLSPIFPQIVRMKSLFKLGIIDEAKLAEIVYAVHRVTRLV